MHFNILLNCASDIAAQPASQHQQRRFSLPPEAINARVRAGGQTIGG